MWFKPLYQYAFKNEYFPIRVICSWEMYANWHMNMNESSEIMKSASCLVLIPPSFHPQVVFLISLQLSFGCILQKPGQLILKESFFVCVHNLKEYQEKLFIVYVWSICKVLRAMLHIKVLIKQVLQSWEMQAHTEVHKKPPIITHSWSDNFISLTKVQGNIKKTKLITQLWCFESECFWLRVTQNSTYHHYAVTDIS